MSEKQVPPAPLAAVDLGSNSFHLVVARFVKGETEVVDRLREQVQLAAGLDEKHHLQKRVRKRALAALERFRERLRGVPRARLRAVGTNTFRKVRDGGRFRVDAEAALGCPIEILSGPEEARLIFHGVAHSMPPEDGDMLVVDIGGGSTECILGAGFDARLVQSVQLGCVSHTQRFFADGVMKRSRFREAIMAARVSLRDVERQFSEREWTRVVGASGTIRAALQVARECGWADRTLGRDSLNELQEALIDARHVEDLDLPGLKSERASVLAGGVAVLRAVFDALHIEAMQVASGALREGILYDLVGRLGHDDVRDRSIEKLQRRFDVDLTQAQRVRTTALEILSEVARPWRLDKEWATSYLSWASSLHEIGLAISYVKHQKHGAYLIGESELSGFSRDDRQVLAAMVACHRGPSRHELFLELPKRVARATRRMTAILRLAVRMRRGRGGGLPAFSVDAGRDRIGLDLVDGFAAHPLLQRDLQKEVGRLQQLGVVLEI